MTDLIRIGFWRPVRELNPSPITVQEKVQAQYTKEEMELPWPFDFINSGWSSSERLMVAMYLQQGRTYASYRGMSRCRLCGCRNGSRDFTDDTYLWPEGYTHYIAAHGVKPPQEFINHVRNKTTLAVGPAYEFEKNLVVSTAHVTQEDSQRLADDIHVGGAIVYDLGPYGFLVYCGADEAVGDDVLNKYSKAFRKLMKLGRELGCQYIHLDRDGPTYGGLEKFDW